uniref:Uncharacterized protein n=1 Tax=Anguilla anguilla TaxID=7936 RepID=A0A0E9PVX9_ANGAN
MQQENERSTQQSCPRCQVTHKNINK